MIINATAYELRTDRLVLRSITLDHARRLLAGESPAAEDWAPGYPFADEIGLLRLLVDADTEPDGWGSWQVLEHVDAGLRAVGGVGFHGPPDANGEVEAGFGLVPAVRGAGLAAEALVALVGWATRHGARVVYGTTTEDNIASQQTMINAGLRPRAGHVTAEGEVLLAFATAGPVGSPAATRRE